MDLLIRLSSAQARPRRALPVAIRCALALLAAASLQATVITTVVVNGNANPYLAGMPNGSVAKGSDTAPDQSPLFAVNFLTAGQILTFSTSSVCGFSYGGGCGPYSGGDSSADGDLSSDGYTAPENGIAGVHAPYNALLGLYLDDSQPSLTPTPADLAFTGPGSLGIAFNTVSPGLKQVFFIGDGLTGRGTGAVQQFVVPTGATRLFLGSMDGYGWYNNGGSQTVVISSTGSGAVPEPATFGLLGAALSALAVLRRRLRH